MVLFSKKTNRAKKKSNNMLLAYLHVIDCHLVKMAERAGFEPAGEDTANAFRVHHLKPLRHLSEMVGDDRVELSSGLYKKPVLTVERIPQ